MDMCTALNRHVYYLLAPISNGRGDERHHARLIHASIPLAKWAQANNSRAFPSASKSRAREGGREKKDLRPLKWSGAECIE